MSRLRLATLVAIAALSPIAVAVGGGVGGADVPAPGDACTALHATTHDVNGRMMWRNPTMTGAHNLVWQYGGPSSVLARRSSVR